MTSLQRKQIKKMNGDHDRNGSTTNRNRNSGNGDISDDNDGSLVRSGPSTEEESSMGADLSFSSLDDVKDNNNDSKAGNGESISPSADDDDGLKNQNIFRETNEPLSQHQKIERKVPRKPPPPPSLTPQLEQPITASTIRRTKRSLFGWIKLVLFHLFLHAACISLYAVPILRAYSDHQKMQQKSASTRARRMQQQGPKGRLSMPHDPVLDEAHIVSENNPDVSGASSLAQVFTNDYWGRPMNSSSSHKSWRPLTILSFRYLNADLLWPATALTTTNDDGGNDAHHKDLLVHRLINVLTHAATAECVGLLAVKLLVPPALMVNDSAFYYFTYAITKLVFALHPTHVEVTANAANRPHLLSCLAGVLLSDPDTSWIVFLVAVVAGFLSAETFLFNVVPAAATMAAIVYRRNYHFRRQQYPLSLFQQVLFVLRKTYPRIVILVGSSVFYYGARLHLDWLSIPDGLIRPAENPFYTFTGEHRVRNYLYVLSIHVAKAWDVDFVGFSHEYGRACIRPIDDWEDARLLIPAGMVAAVVVFLLYLAFRTRSSGKNYEHSCTRYFSKSFILFGFYLSWMVTLFPVAGIIKVGTFIADRIAVSSTVAVGIIISHALTLWILKPSQATMTTASVSRRQQHSISYSKLIFLLAVGCLMWRRIHYRCIQWMDSISLLESSLETCPRFAKGHLEISKAYSGLYADKFNLTRSRWHLEQVEQIDPDFCDVHQQFAHVAAQENSFVEFEERIVKAVVCPFSTGGSLPLFQQYWRITIEDAQRQGNALLIQQTNDRYKQALATIQQAAEEEEKQETKQRSNSPLVMRSH